ncbi:MAG: hypothetical protein HN742_09335 [Lentisphaerae bacterium]|nr:hypothetical protein [Lentisphaerota bacterium]
MTDVDFIDGRWIAHSYFLERTVARPPRVSPEPVIVPAGAHGSVVPTADGLAMWYSTVRWVPFKGGKTHQTWIHYATSRDGITFELPELGSPEEGNVIIAGNDTGADGKPLTGVRGCSGICVLDAEQQTVPHARARYTAMYRAWIPGKHGGLSLACSNDGLHWTGYAENTLRIGESDTFNNFFYDEKNKQYVAYVRPLVHAGPSHVNRCMARIESDDMIHWGNEQLVLDTDDADASAVGTVNEAKHADGTPYPRGRNKQYYGLTVTPYQDLYLGLASFYDVEPGTMWIELLHSYDGVTWRREPKREPLIDVGQGEAWDAGLAYYPAAGCPVAVGDEWFIYYAGTNFDHHSKNRSRKDLGQYRGMGAVRLPRGRLVGYTAGEAAGELITRSFKWTNSELLLNTDAAGGSVEVAICNAGGSPIKGFTRHDAEPIRSDGLRVPVSFRGSAALASLRGRDVRLRVHAERAAVYGFSMS